jgi:hypothetical protein
MSLAIEVVDVSADTACQTMKAAIIVKNVAGTTTFQMSFMSLKELIPKPPLKHVHAVQDPLKTSARQPLFGGRIFGGENYAGGLKIPLKMPSSWLIYQ